MVNQTDQVPQEQLEQFQRWLEHPITQQFRNLLVREIDRIKEEWSMGDLVRETEFQSLLVGANVQGQLSLARRLLELEPADLFPEEEL